jgi:hypothetical protein
MAMIYSNIRIEGKPSLPEGTGGMITQRFVTPGYFQTLGIPIVKAGDSWSPTAAPRMSWC